MWDYVSLQNIFLVHFMDHLRSVTIVACPAQLNVRELSKEWAGIFANIVWVDKIWNEVHRYNPARNVITTVCQSKV